MRTLLLVASLLSIPAWATGERVVLTPANNPLKETLCISMNCVNGNGQVTVSARAVKAGLEFTVVSAGGQVKLVTTAPVKSDGRVSSTDLVRASSLVVQAIEGNAPTAEKAPAPAPKAKKIAAAKRGKAKLRLLASNR